MKLLLLLIILLVFSHKAFAQEDLVTPPNSVKLNKQCLRTLEEPGFSPGSVVYRFEGFHAIAFRFAKRYYNSAVNDYLLELWKHSNLSFLEYQEKVDMFSLREAECNGGRWWGRSWRDSLLPEKGGIKDLTVQYGKEIEAFGFWGIGITTEGKVRTSDFLLFFDGRRGPSSDPISSIHPQAVGMQLYTFQSTPKGNIFTGQYFNCNLKTSIRLALPETLRLRDFAWVVAAASLQVDIGVFMHHQRLGTFSFRAEYEAPLLWSVSAYFFSFSW